MRLGAWEYLFAKMLGKNFFPTPEDYVMSYVLLASGESRTMNGVIIEMHGQLGAAAKPPQ